jgi:hypothetical protein
LVLIFCCPFLVESCTSFLSAGPLGYETTGLPVAVSTEEHGATVGFVEAQTSLPGSVLYVEDYSMNLFLTAGAGWSTPGWHGLSLSLPVAASGFVGAASLKHGLSEQYPHGVFKPYYGASVQVQPSVNCVTDQRDLRLSFGTIAWVNAETGPFASFRSTVHGDAGYDFVNDSPTPWSGGWGYWLEVAGGKDRWFGGRLTFAGAAPDLTSEDAFRTLSLGTRLGGVVERLEVWTEQDHNRFLVGYEFLFPLNVSWMLGYMRTF